MGVTFTRRRAAQAGPETGGAQGRSTRNQRDLDAEPYGPGPLRSGTHAYRAVTSTPPGAPVDDRDIARWRAHSLRLHGTPFADAVAVVGGLLAVQAENHPQAAWAVATRGDGVTASSFAQRFDAGDVLRTHVLRPTWHFVLPDDIRWLLDLTAPRIRRAFVQAQRQEGMADRDLERAREVVVAALSGGKHLTRPALGAVLAAAGVAVTAGQRGLVLADAELAGLICSGPMLDGAHTYALLAERASAARRLDRDEALTEIAVRYFTGHGPATERDLAYWASLTLTDVRAGIAAADGRLASFEHDGRTWWYGDEPPADPHPQPRAHLLQTLDEYHNGVQDSRHVLDVAGIVPRGRATMVGMVLVDTQMVGGHRRTVTGDEVRFELGLLRDLDDAERAAVQAAAERCAGFLEVDRAVVAV